MTESTVRKLDRFEKAELYILRAALTLLLLMAVIKVLKVEIWDYFKEPTCKTSQSLATASSGGCLSL